MGFLARAKSVGPAARTKPVRLRLAGWLAIALVLVTPFLFYFSIKALRSAIDTAETEFENRDLSRAVWQTRFSFALATGTCPIKETAIAPLALQSCLVHLEAALSQFDVGVEKIDPSLTLRAQLNALVDRTETLLREGSKSATGASALAGYAAAWQRADDVLVKLGSVESEHWMSSAVEHLELRRRLSQLSAIQVSLLTLFLILNLAFLSMLVRIISANAKVIEAQHEIESQRAQLAHSAKLSSLGEMAGGIAHEINNPLTVINGRVQLLRTLANDGTLELPFLRESCDRITRNVERITGIIRSMRSMARDLPGEPLRLAPVDALIGDTLDLCRERFRQRGITLRVRNETLGQKVLCRPNEVGQILLNVLNNAWDAVAELPEAERWVEIQITRMRERVSIRVTDAGRGIPAEVLPRIFEPFFTTKALSKGTGLGMSISRSLAEGQGGRFFVNPECPNTQFVLELNGER